MRTLYACRAQRLWINPLKLTPGGEPILCAQGMSMDSASREQHMNGSVGTAQNGVCVTPSKAGRSGKTGAARTQKRRGKPPVRIVIQMRKTVGRDIEHLGSVSLCEGMAKAVKTAFRKLQAEDLEMRAKSVRGGA